MAEKNPSAAWSRRAALGALLLAAWPAALRAAEAQASPEEAVILAAGGYWRQHVTRMPPLVSAASAKAAGIKLDDAARQLTLRGGRSKLMPGRSSPPPPGWTEVGFDDGAWDLVRGAFATERQELGLLCRRGKFLVTDPAAVKKLALEIDYCGGVAAYLNGREVLRASLPPGRLHPGTAGQDYPEEAFFVKDGPRKGELLHHYYDRQRTDQLALRQRTVGPVALPLELLRKGVNVLAVRCHSSHYPARCRQAGLGEFAAVALNRLFLRAVAADGAVTPALARPAGFHVWNADVIAEVTELSFPPPGEPLTTIRLSALRNGRFSGQVVVGSTTEIAGLAAEVGDLARAGGGRIPASAIQVRYGLPGRLMHFLGGHVYGGPTGPSLGVYFRRFDGLASEPPTVVPVTRPAEKLRGETRAALGLPGRPVPGAVAPIWATVEVPAEAAAGVYTGALTISAKDQKAVVVPLELEVFDWALPDVADYVSRLSVYQSPDTLAAHYGVPLWSERHWRLIERSVQLIGQAGNHAIIIPLLSKEQLGNEESYVHWVRQADGSFTYDTTVMDRHLDLYLKHHDPRRIQAVCCVVWGNAGVASGNPYQKEKYDERGLPKQTRGTFTVTAVDAATGTRSDMPLPPLGGEEYRDFWRPVLLKVREGLAKRGLADRMMLGMPADPPIPALAVKAFHDILPEVGWFVGSHQGAGYYRYDREDKGKRVPASHVERVYTAPIPDPATKRHFGWRRKDMVLAFNRYGFGPLCLFPDPAVWPFRVLMEADLAADYRGAGRIGADYWQMPGIKYNSGGGGTFYARYPQSAIGQTGMASNCAALLAPGPAGPVTSARFENVREGTQNAEAVIFIQRALLEKDVTGDLAAKCWRLLDERVNAIRGYTFGLGRAGWRQRDRELYELAGEVAGQLRPAGKSSNRPGEK